MLGLKLRPRRADGFESHRKCYAQRVCRSRFAVSAPRGAACERTKNVRLALSRLGIGHSAIMQRAPILCEAFPG